MYVARWRAARMSIRIWVHVWVLSVCTVGWPGKPMVTNAWNHTHNWPPKGPHILAVPYCSFELIMTGFGVYKPPIMVELEDSVTFTASPSSRLSEICKLLSTPAIEHLANQTWLLMGACVCVCLQDLLPDVWRH